MVYCFFSVLKVEGFVDCDEESVWWMFGFEFFLMGLVVVVWYDVIVFVRDIVCLFVVKIEESVFFLVCWVDEIVCFFCEEGFFLICFFVFSEGVWFFFGVVSVGLVIFVFFFDYDVDVYFECYFEFEIGWGCVYGVWFFCMCFVEMKECGYVVNFGLIVEGSWGLGVVVFDW